MRRPVRGPTGARSLPLDAAGDRRRALAAVVLARRRRELGDQLGSRVRAMPDLTAGGPLWVYFLLVAGIVVRRLRGRAAQPPRARYYTRLPRAPSERVLQHVRRLPPASLREGGSSQTDKALDPSCWSPPLEEGWVVSSN